MGASFGNSSTTKAPCEVSNLIMKFVLPSRARGRRDRGASVHNGSRRGQAPLSHPCPASHRARGAATPRARGARAALTPGLEALASLREIVRGAPAHLA